MSPKLADVIAAGKALDADEHGVAALALHYADEQTPDDEEGEIDAQWDAAIDSRIDDILSGKVELVDGEETMRIANARLAARNT